ncbi:MAG: hypothetical protein R2877_07070 [Bdellovibrionota bacterium]
MTAPFTRHKLYGWTEDQVNVKYRESGGIKCSNCHAGGDANGGFNSLRFAFHNFNGNNGQWMATNTRDNNYYDMELFGAGGASNEPRDSDDLPVDPTISETTMYKLTENGAIVSTPRILAEEIASHPGSTECW